MGVRFLERYINHSVYKGTKTIKILEEIETYKSNHAGAKPMIVVDLCGFVQIHKLPEDALFGMRSVETIKRGREFLQKLKTAGADLVFIRDSRIGAESKREHWLERQNNNYKWQIDLIDAIAKGTPTAQLIQQKLNKFHPGQIVLSTILKSMVKGLGAHFDVTENCDINLAIAAYANENNAMAILGNNTNYLIHDGNWRLWMLGKICVATMTTVEYDKVALRKDLRLTQEQMPLYATLCGNDFVKYDDVFTFHKTLARKYGHQEREQNVAQYVRQYLFISAELSGTDLQYLAKTVFTPRDDWTDCIKALRVSLESYSYEKYKEIRLNDVKTDPFVAKLYDEDFISVLTVLQGAKIRVQSFYDDLRVYESPTAYVRLRSANQMDIELRMREMGMLLVHQNKSGTHITREIYTKLVHDKNYSLLEVTPVFPHMPVPELEKLIFRSKDDGLDGSREHLLQWIFKFSFVARDVLKIEPEFIELLIALSYLIQEHDFTIDEADIFTCAYYDVYANRVQEVLEMPEIINPRAFRLVYIFLKIYSSCYRVLKSTGLKDFIVPTIFDGMHFHALYNKWPKLDPDEKLQRLHEIEKFRDIYTNDNKTFHVSN